MAKTIKELTQDLLQAPSACKEIKDFAGKRNANTLKCLNKF